MHALLSTTGMSRSDAEGVFLRHGVSATSLSGDDLRRAWLNLGRKHHPDRGGDGRAMCEINAAYDSLRRLPPDPTRNAGPEEEYTVWGFDGASLTRGPAMVCAPAELRALADHALRAMRRGFRHQRAILVQRKGERWEVGVLYCAGQYHVPPLRLTVGAEPENDVLLLRRLSSLVTGA